MHITNDQMTITQFDYVSTKYENDHERTVMKLKCTRVLVSDSSSNLILKDSMRIVSVFYTMNSLLNLR